MKQSRYKLKLISFREYKKLCGAYYSNICCSVRNEKIKKQCRSSNCTEWNKLKDGDMDKNQYDKVICNNAKKCGDNGDGCIHKDEHFRNYATCVEDYCLFSKHKVKCVKVKYGNK